MAGLYSTPADPALGDEEEEEDEDEDEDEDDQDDEDWSSDAKDIEAKSIAKELVHEQGVSLCQVPAR